MSGLTKWLIAAFALAMACGGSTAPIPPLGAARTEATLVGPLCTGGLCQCREEVKKKFVAGEPDAGFKRFEVRIGPIGNDLRVEVGPHKIYKSAERPTDCYYIDLPPGEHAVTVRGHGDPSFGAAVRISEMGSGPQAPWYETFIFECGSNVCSVDDLKYWRSETEKLGPAHDPCGSTKVSAVNYRHGSVPDGLHPIDLLLEATLQVYNFKPEKPPCR